MKRKAAERLADLIDPDRALREARPACLAGRWLENEVPSLKRDPYVKSFPLPPPSDRCDLALTTRHSRDTVGRSALIREVPHPSLRALCGEARSPAQYQHAMVGGAIYPTVVNSDQGISRAQQTPDSNLTKKKPHLVYSGRVFGLGHLHSSQLQRVIRRAVPQDREEHAAQLPSQGHHRDSLSAASGNPIRPLP